MSRDAAVAAGPLPPDAPLAMPVQDLRAVVHVAPRRASMRTRFARWLTFGGAAALTVSGAVQMFRAFGPDSVSALQIALQVLFVLTFGWIALSATAAVAGLLLGPRRRAFGAGRPPGRTAIVMPVYNENAAAAFGALAALGRGLAARGWGEAFEIFVLSDTFDPDALARETTAFAALRDALGGRMASWWRRRGHNAGRKAGNVKAFVERWGGRYDFMLVLDADSAMDPDTVAEMVRRMDAAPRLALLQTAPALIGGQTLFARLQQFAAAVHGPVVARGVAAWQGEDGNFWGHNALIRVGAFAQAAGLPTLPGRAPFGGDVMSHDFVEAALLRRAGWDVRMDPDLGGSWEGVPPTLASAAIRDRRWAQGNLQHLSVIGARGLRWPNRAHMAIGIGSYLMAPVWALMLTVGLALAAQAALTQPDYFPQMHQLFPTWPRFDAERMMTLLFVSAGLLLLPKAMGVLEVLLSSGRRQALGGGLRVLAGAVLEILLTALLAPIQMLAQCRSVAEILLGLDSGWWSQDRVGAAPNWRTVLRRHWPSTCLGLAVAAAVWSLQPKLLPWLSPILAGLIGAPVLVRLAAQAQAGRALRRAGLLIAPEETVRAVPLCDADRMAAAIAADSADGLAALALDPRLARRHASLVTAVGAGEPATTTWLAHLTAGAKLGAAPCTATALAWLDRDERIALLSDAGLLSAFTALPGSGDQGGARAA